MTKEQLQALIDTNDIGKLKESLENLSLVRDFKTLIDQYEIAGHPINDNVERKDKYVYGENGEIKAKIKVARLPLAYQKNIVMVAAAFLGRPALKYTAQDDLQERFGATIEDILDDNKFDYKFMTTVKKTKSERQSAIIIYNQELESGSDFWSDFQVIDAPKFKIRMRVVAKSLGDDLYPVFDASGDMIAFGRAYCVKEKVNGADVETNYFELYTADKIYISKKEGSDNWETTPYINYVKKIPVAYFCQPFTDSEDVEELIRRFEVKISNHADTNDYFDSPIVKTKGKIESFAQKDTAGKLLEMSEGADAEYLTYDSLPESMKMEMDNLKSFIELFSHTPDISLQSLKSLGYFSNMAMKVLFMDAHLKAYDSEEIFGDGCQRLFNYLKANLVQIAPEFKAAKKLKIQPVFTYFLPKNEEEEISNIVKAYGAGILSKESAVKLNPLVSDAVDELALIAAEHAVNDANKMALALASNPLPIPPAQ